MGIWQWLFGRSKENEREEFSLPPAAPALPPSVPALPPSAPELTAPAPPPQPSPPRFGVDEAMALMRALPLDDDSDLVLRVVRKTLQSTGVSVEELVASARKREIAHEETLANDRDSIAQLERDIAARKAHIEEVVAQLKETESLRKRLQEAMENESKVGVLIPPHEMMRLQAEAAAAASRPPPSTNPSPPVVETTEVEGGKGALGSQPSVVAAPKASAPIAPPLKTSKPPKPPPVLPSRSVNPPDSARTAPNIDQEIATDPESLAGEGPPSEPTLKVALDASSVKSEPSKAPVE